MNEIKIFESPEFGSVRIVNIDNEPYFVGKDVCEVFGDKNHIRSIGRIPNEDKQYYNITDTLGRPQTVTIINESGLYELLFSMQPQKANNGGEVQNAYPTEIQERIEKLKKFKRWVTHEVLPSIRKHGAYMTDEALHRAITEPDFLIQLATELKQEQEKRKELESKIEQDRPKVIFADAVEVAKTSILIGDLAKILKQNGVNIGQNRLFERLRSEGYLIKSGERKNMPTQTAMEMKLFEVKESTVNNPDGSVRITRTTKVTGKGQQYFINRYLKEIQADTVW